MKIKKVILSFILIQIIITLLILNCSHFNNPFLKEIEYSEKIKNKYKGPIWTWVSGSNSINQPGIYGAKGTPSRVNTPGARERSITWTDSNGNLWLFGGGGFDSSGIEGYLNDLWMFNGTDWIWISGSNLRNQTGIYGTINIQSETNYPGGRSSSICWFDSNSNLWMFGGSGIDREGNYGHLNDLWKYDGTNWTWISGSNIRNQAGCYDVKGRPSRYIKPGARFYSTSWIDSQDNLWLFGGWGYDDYGHIGQLNDLWKFDGVNWTWISGSNIRNQFGSYGTKGIPSETNIPEARAQSISWTDSSNNLWLFGGIDPGLYGYCRENNDLWKFDGIYWTWISGSNIRNQVGNYGVKGITSDTNMPAARYGSISWIDFSGNFWLFGGEDNDHAGIRIYSGELNDLWVYDGTNWTWISGSNTINQPGIYGRKNISSTNNIPGARYGSISWTDNSGNLWLFGGHGYDSFGNEGKLNDLWKFEIIN